MSTMGDGPGIQPWGTPRSPTVIRYFCVIYQVALGGWLAYLSDRTDECHHQQQRQAVVAPFVLHVHLPFATAHKPTTAGAARPLAFGPIQMRLWSTSGAGCRQLFQPLPRECHLPFYRKFAIAPTLLVPLCRATRKSGTTDSPGRVQQSPLRQLNPEPCSDLPWLGALHLWTKTHA